MRIRSGASRCSSSVSGSSSSSSTVSLTSRPPASTASSDDPILLRAARGERTERAPAWMMRQAGRYQAVYRKLAEKHPSFRTRSETPELIVEISLQPFESFRPDGVILFSDILTPLPAVGIPFEIDNEVGPVLEKTIRSKDDMSMMHDIDLSKVSFTGEALTTLRGHLDGTGATLLGFVGSPFTLGTYIVEGQTSRLYKTVKTMALTEPTLLLDMLDKLAVAVAEYACFQIEAGAQVIQIFDSWGGQLPPTMWESISKPSIVKTINLIKEKHPDVPLTLYANGSGGLLERIASTGVNCVGVDWTVDMADAAKRLPADKAMQGNVDPVVLFADENSIEAAVKDCVKKAQSNGPRGHVLNLGHGVIVGTPEEAVATFFAASKETFYDKM
ncbi:uroporphyrinogen decarboxylase [Pseudoscourfieldia marina]